MNWIVRYCLILAFLCGIYTGKSQDIFHRADSLYNAGDYQLSGLAFEWILYSGNSPEHKARAVLGRVQSFKKQDLFEKAGIYLDKVNIIDLPDYLRAEILYESILVNFLSNNYQEAISRYLMARSILDDSDFKNKGQLVYCLSQLNSGQWAKAINSGQSYIETSAPPDIVDSLLNQFHNILDTLQLPRMKNPKTARILSMIIPGSGQAYSGYPGDGFLSFSLHLLALGGAGLTFSQGLFVTGWLGGFGLLQKLYFGGVLRAEELAKQKNRLNRENFIQPAFTLMVGIAELSE